tara:strand:+ start:13729 stop:15420 length:1692 start_codon:yes stop_codon:yes gene_type:complete
VSDQELERVKQILVGDLRDALQSIEARFEHEAFLALVTDVVAEALEQRTDTDSKISDVLAPTIDQAITGSINQDPKKLASSLYPIMGPAIRKSISETLQQMMENFNQLLEESVSPQSIRWRFDAWRTGRSYSELVMLNTIEFRIEQVFLIHRETSLLIQHQVSDLTDVKDPDMVSSMFSAIQDFIEDSFSTNETNELNTLRLGDLTVVIQRGPAAVLAAVVRGRVPEDLRVSMVRLLESLHGQKRSQLADYSGDPAEFIELEPDVRQLLQSEKKQQEKAKKKFPWLAVISIAVILSAIGYWQWLGFEINQQQKHLIKQLEATAGITLLEAKFSRDELNAKLLVDPDATQPDTILADATAEFSTRVTTTPYLSIEDKILQRRAMRILTPEEDIQLRVVDRILWAEGTATTNWLAQAQQQWMRVAGIESFDFNSLIVVNPDLDRINALTRELESFVFEFESGKAEIDTSTTQFQNLVTDVKSLLTQAKRLGYTVKIDVVGFTDASGSDRINRILGLQRALTLTTRLVENGIPATALAAYRSQDYPTFAEETSRETKLVVTLEAEN